MDTVLLIILIVAAIGIFAFLFIGWLADRLTTRRGWQKGADPKIKAKNKPPFEPSLDWLEAAHPQDVYLTSENGLMLHAYAIENAPDRNWVIICHGYTSNASASSKFGEKYEDMGFNVLLIDARAHGKSEGKYIGMGWPERRDVIKWAEYLNDNYQAKHIVLHGVSMGGATVMMASGEADLPQNVCAIVEDCGYSSIMEEIRFVLKHTMHMAPRPIMHASNIFFRLHNGFSFYREGFADKQVAKSHTPILFIHGDADDFVPLYMLNKVYEAALCTKEKLIVPGAGHGRSVVTDPPLYWQTISDFLDNHMKI